MKSHLTLLVLALIAGYIGGFSNNYFQSHPAHIEQAQKNSNADPSSAHQAQGKASDLALQISQIHKRISLLEMQLNEVTHTQINATDNTENDTKESTEKRVHQSRQVALTKDNLLSAGINPDTANDVLRRISQHNFRKVELQNLIQRNNSPDTQQYREELIELNRNNISLRTEIGDDAYDKYLVASGQNNRMKVSSVIIGSPAESNGILKDDVILHYGEQRIFSWHDMRDATLNGDIGSFTNVEILRDGARMNLVVPRGSLGVQLEALQLDPDQYQ